MRTSDYIVSPLGKASQRELVRVENVWSGLRGHAIVKY